MSIDPGKALLLFGQFVLVAAAAYAVIVVLLSHMRYQDLFKETALLQRSGPEGLLETQLASRLGTTYRENVPFSTLIVRPQNWEELSAVGRANDPVPSHDLAHLSAVLRFVAAKVLP